MTPQTAILTARSNRRHLIAAAGVALAGCSRTTTTTLAQDDEDRDQATVLIAGLDTRDPEGPQNTDVLLIARVDLDAGTVRALSIPRDLWVDIPGAGRGKIGTAYNAGLQADPDRDWESGIASTIATVEANFGLEIDGAAVTDFAGLPAIVDAVGGITVDNPYTIYEPDSDAVMFPEGPITLDGEEALQYVRVRHQDGDNGRVMRQQLVLAALLEQAHASGLLQDVPTLLDVASEAVLIDLPLELQFRLAGLAPNLAEEDVTFGTITDRLTEGESEDGQWIYEADWETLPAYVQRWLDGDVE